jgi:hypothetical protein
MRPPPARRRPARRPRVARAWLLVAGAGILLWFGPTAMAAPLTLEGITFSVVSGEIVLDGGYGRGSLEEPFVIFEEMRGATGGVLRIEDLSGRFGNRVKTFHAGGFALRKVVTNATRDTWFVFVHELRQHPDRPSDRLDGLSFAQAAELGPPQTFTSDVFAEADVTREPTDHASFTGGVVAPGETVTFDLVITDASPLNDIYLLQQPELPIVAR